MCIISHYGPRTELIDIGLSLATVIVGLRCHVYF